MVSFMQKEYNDNLPQCKKCECNKGSFPTHLRDAYKPSLLILTNAKDSKIIDLIYHHASLTPCCFTHW